MVNIYYFLRFPHYSYMGADAAAEQRDPDGFDPTVNIRGKCSALCMHL